MPFNKVGLFFILGLTGRIKVSHELRCAYKGREFTMQVCDKKGPASLGVISLAIIKALNQSSSLTYPKLQEKVPNLRYTYRSS
jgi:hypothetical protein